MDQTITLEFTLDEIRRLISAIHELIDRENSGQDTPLAAGDKALLMKLIEVVR